MALLIQVEKCSCDRLEFIKDANENEQHLENIEKEAFKSFQHAFFNVNGGSRGK